MAQTPLSEKPNAYAARIIEIDGKVFVAKVMPTKVARGARRARCLADPTMGLGSEAWGAVNAGIRNRIHNTSKPATKGR